MKSVMGGVTTYYIGTHFEWTGSTSTMIKYYYAGSQRVAMRQGSNAPLYLSGDHLGSTSLTTNNDGTLNTTQRYYPWGSTRAGSSPTAYQFTGQRNDYYIKLYHMGARMYDPELGRFISPDSIIPNPANPQSLNRYAYVLNNPLRYTDPSGYFSEEQLNWMGYYRDQVTAELWELLLLLEPDDYLELLGNGNAGSIAIGHRGADSKGAKWGLYAVSNAGATELLDWIGKTSVENIQVTRQIGTGEAAWNYTWRGIQPRLAHTMGQTGFIQSEQGARFNRLFSASFEELRDFLIGLIPLPGITDAATAALGIGGAWSLDGGDLPGDVAMEFAYFNSQTGQIVARAMWLRLSMSQERSGLMVTLSNEWSTVHLPSFVSVYEARAAVQQKGTFHEAR